VTELEYWPEALVVDTDSVLTDEQQWRHALTVAEETSQRLELRQPIRFGQDTSRDIAALRFLQMATERYSHLRWHLAGELPWPLRTVAHLCPPVSRAGDPVTADWRNQYTIALCTYRIGPNFVSLRDRRPDGQQIRAKLDEPWISTFQALAADCERQGGQAGRLLDELASAGLALIFEDGRHMVLPTRLYRWPVPYNVV
jgi:hypothetical protein